MIYIYLKAHLFFLKAEFATEPVTHLEWSFWSCWGF